MTVLFDHFRALTFSDARCDLSLLLVFFDQEKDLSSSSHQQSTPLQKRHQPSQQSREVQHTQGVQLLSATTQPFQRPLHATSFDMQFDGRPRTTPIGPRAEQKQSKQKLQDTERKSGV